MWIPRALETRLLSLARQRPVLVLTGARQTGKTSLVRRLFPEHAFVSLDLPSEAELAEKDPREFLARHPPPVVVDEVQYAPGLLRHIKVGVDGARGRNGRFVLTGSQKLPLMQGVAESLAGRAEVLELEGLSFQELAGIRPEVRPAEFAARGSLPELWEKPDLDAPGFWRSYVVTYLERDLRSMLAVTSLRDFERFLVACALRSAQLLNKADLSRDVGVSPSTAAQWLALLHASNQVFLLEPWFSNRGKSLVKTPKLYLADPGLLCHLIGVHDDRELGASPLAGAVWETAVCAELRKALRWARRESSFFFWRDRTREVDFLVHSGGKFRLFEAKWTEHPNAQDLRHLQAVTGELGPARVQSGEVVCRTASAYPLPGGARAITLRDVSGS